MAKRDNGGAAFPRTGFFPKTEDALGDIDSLRERMPTVTEPQDGMTLRDYFAAKAMQAEMITTFSDATPQAAAMFAAAASAAGQTAVLHLAMNAYAIADAMIAERNK